MLLNLTILFYFLKKTLEVSSVQRTISYLLDVPVVPSVEVLGFVYSMSTLYNFSIFSFHHAVSL